MILLAIASDQSEAMAPAGISRPSTFQLGQSVRTPSVIFNAR
jgi:hypothetical protein